MQKLNLTCFKILKVKSPGFWWRVIKKLVLTFKCQLSIIFFLKIPFNNSSRSLPLNLNHRVISRKCRLLFLLSFRFWFMKLESGFHASMRTNSSLFICSNLRAETDELRRFEGVENVFYVKNLQMLVFIEWAKEEKMSGILCSNLKLENVHQKLFPQWTHVKFSMLLTIFRKRPFLCLAPGAKLFSAHWLSHFLLVKIFSYNF